MNNTDEFCYWVQRYMSWVGFTTEFAFVDNTIFMRIYNEEFTATFSVPASITAGYPREVAESRVVVALVAAIKERIRQSNEEHEIGCAVDEALSGKDEL